MVIWSLEDHTNKMDHGYNILPGLYIKCRSALAGSAGSAMTYSFLEFKRNSGRIQLIKILKTTHAMTGNSTSVLKIAHVGISAIDTRTVRSRELKFGKEVGFHLGSISQTIGPGSPPLH